MILYLDTSAAVKLLVDERGSAALADRLEAGRRSGDDVLVSSLLLHTELHCASNRRPEDLPRDAVAAVLSTVALVDVERGDLTTAPLLPGRLRSADAVHLATALRVGAQAMAVYDGQLRSAVEVAGIGILDPA
ncbi:MAG: type II toxin-antitoxin system VapC family toxin [Acidimicrobiales bacterium]